MSEIDKLTASEFNALVAIAERVKEELRLCNSIEDYYDLLLSAFTGAFLAGKSSATINPERIDKH